MADEHSDDVERANAAGRRKHWASLDTPRKAIVDALRNLLVCQEWTDTDINSAADIIAYALHNAGHIGQFDAVLLDIAAKVNARDAEIARLHKHNAAKDEVVAAARNYSQRRITRTSYDSELLEKLDRALARLEHAQVEPKEGEL